MQVPEDLSFEDAFNRLEEAVTRLEAGGMTIEDMVARFEEGMALVKLCYQKLDAAQARVRLLARNDRELEGPHLLDRDEDLAIPSRDEA